MPEPIVVDWNSPSRTEITDTTISTHDPFDRGLIAVPGDTMTVSYPVTGSTHMLQYRASTFSLSPQYGEVKNDRVEVTITARELTADTINTHLEQAKRSVTNRVDWANADLAKFRSDFTHTLLRDYETRKKRILSQRAVEAAISIPIHRKEGAPPAVKAQPKLVPLGKRRSQENFVPEPLLEDAVYNDILSAISSWSRTFERNPRTWVKLQEEDLRDLLLATLNSYWRGAASGELFNGHGKTDVLIRHEDRNAFIAECKIWSGPQAVGQAIDQLLSYLVWRDSKAALIMFIKTQNPEATIDKLHTAVKQHPSYLTEAHNPHDHTWGSYIFTADDEQRRITLTVIPVVVGQ